MSPATEEAAVVRHIVLEVPIDATCSRVWSALVEDTTAWWHGDFYAGPEHLGFHLEPKLGGWMYEDWGDGNGLIWGTVIGLRAGQLLQVVGDTSRDWGGPNRGIMTWTLTADDADADKTVLRFTHDLHGCVAESTRDALDGGWRLLFEGCMKPYIETGKAPAS